MQQQKIQEKTTRTGRKKEEQNKDSWEYQERHKGKKEEIWEVKKERSTGKRSYEEDNRRNRREKKEKKQLLEERVRQFLFFSRNE